MCGIVAATAQRDVTSILVAGLGALEYRGYDSAGLALLQDGALSRLRTGGKVRELQKLLAATPLQGHCGIAHTRWATHGVANEQNAHPHMSCGELALVHNGIIENHESLRAELVRDGYVFQSDTDTEVIAHLIHRLMAQGHGLFAAVSVSD